MQGSTPLWSTLEVAKLLASVLTPVSLALLGWFISGRLKRLEMTHWSNQKLIEKRLQIFDLIAPSLNRLLCFYTWIGTWKSITPADVLLLKRELDRTLHIYRHVFDDAVYERYQAYMALLFETYSGAGMDARIRSDIRCRKGDRVSHAAYPWDPAWDKTFSTEQVTDREHIRQAYLGLMRALRTSVGGAESSGSSARLPR